jgi:hypothetical protein
LIPALLLRLHHTLMMETASTSETLINFYQTTRCYSPEDSHLHTRRPEKLNFFYYPPIYAQVFPSGLIVWQSRHLPFFSFEL